MNITDFAQYLSKYFHEHLAHRRGVSQNTMKSYRDTFKLLLQYLQDRHKTVPEKVTLDILSSETICDFLAWVEKERSCSARTKNQRLASLHSFFRYLQVEAPERIVQSQRILAIPRCKWRSAPVHYLSVEGIVALLSAPDKDTADGRRDAALLTILYDSAARVQEMADVSVRDLRLSPPAHVSLTGKGGKTRIVPLMDLTVSMMREYIDKENLVLTERQDWPLFRNRRGERLTRFGIGHILNKYIKAARRKDKSLSGKVSPHTLRHSKAMHLLEAGSNCIVIQAILGHADIKTTTMYARANLDMMRKALEKTVTAPPERNNTKWKDDPDLLKWLKSL
jgi:site-specific recombinase XerD